MACASPYRPVSRDCGNSVPKIAYIDLSGFEFFSEKNNYLQQIFLVRLVLDFGIPKESLSDPYFMALFGVAGLSQKLFHFFDYSIFEYSCMMAL
jgi:hypothetical protein